jgi:hypothetical protein
LRVGPPALRSGAARELIRLRHASARQVVERQEQRKRQRKRKTKRRI